MPTPVWILHKQRAIATANLQMDLPEFDPKNMPEWAQEVSDFLLFTCQ